MIETSPALTDPEFWRLASQHWELALFATITMFGPLIYLALADDKPSNKKASQKLNLLRYTNFL